MSDEPIILPVVLTLPQVRFSDTDAMGHISSMSYAAWAEVGRADFFGATGDPETPWFVLKKLSLEFHSEGRFGEAFELETRAVRVGTSSLTLAHEIRVGARRVASIEVVMVAFDPEARRSRPINPRWRLPEA